MAKLADDMHKNTLIDVQKAGIQYLLLFKDRFLMVWIGSDELLESINLEL